MGTDQTTRNKIGGGSILDKDILMNLRKFLVPEIVYGEGAIQLAGRHAENFGATRALLVTDSGVRAAGWVARVEESLRQAHISHVIYDEITPNPKDHEVMAGGDLCRAEACDLIIAVGGGSAMDCAKGIGVVTGNAGHILDFEGVDAVPNPGPPLIFIPTTAGSSADVSQFAIITDTTRKLKIAIVSKMVIPDIALVDPETTCTMSPDLTAATGMDALCHAFEAYVSTASSRLTDMAALSSVRLIAENLVEAHRHPGNMTFRNNMMMASLMAGLAFSNASLGLVHAMAHSLGGVLGLPHGECNAVLLEKIVQYNYSKAPGKYDQLADAMGRSLASCPPEERADALKAELAALRKRLGISMHLADLGVSDSDITRLSGYAMEDPCVATNPRQPVVADIEKMYRELY